MFSTINIVCIFFFLRFIDSIAGYVQVLKKPIHFLRVFKHEARCGTQYCGVLLAVSLQAT